MAETKSKRLTRNCEMCGTVFTTTPYWISIGKGRFCSQGCASKRKRGTMAEKFAKKTGPPEATGCIHWKGKLTKGYGRIYNDEGHTIGAHQAAWILKHGAIPAGLFVCHSCDNPACVNIAHLFLGTQKQNMEDCVTKARQNRGEKNGEAKLTEGKIRAIRQRRKEGAQYRQIAEEFGIDFSNVGYIIRGKTWRHVG